MFAPSSSCSRRHARPPASRPSPCRLRGWEIACRGLLVNNQLHARLAVCSHPLHAAVVPRVDHWPVAHDHGVGEVRRARALRLLVDDQPHPRALARCRLAQLLLQRAQQWQIRRQRDQLVQSISGVVAEARAQACDHAGTTFCLVVCCRLFRWLTEKKLTTEERRCAA